MQELFDFKPNSLAYLFCLNVKTVLFQAIQSIISTQFSFIRPIDGTLSGAITLYQRGPRSDNNDGALRILQISSIIGTSQSDCLVFGGGGLPFCRDAVVVFFSCKWNERSKVKSSMKLFVFLVALLLLEKTRI